MSRRSLRLDDGLLDRHLPHNSASFSVGGVSWRSNRSLKSRPSQRHSASCSELLHPNTTPRKAAGPSLLNSSLHSVASDASLISSLLDESSIQESTLVGTFWGLDHDVDPKESTIMAEESSVMETSLTASRCRCAKQSLSRVYCQDCSGWSAPKADWSSGEPETSVVYCRERGRRTARSGQCGAMSLTEPNPKELPASGSLCDDCKEKQLSETHPVASSWSSWSSAAARLLELTCSAAVFTGSISKATHLLTSGVTPLCSGAASNIWCDSTARLLSQRAAAALRPLIRTVFSASLRAGRSAGRTGFRWLCGRWRHMTASPQLTGVPVRLFVGLLPLLLLFSLCWFGPAGFPSILPGVNVTAWMTAVPDGHNLLPSESQSVESMAARLQSPSPPAETEPRELPAAAGDSARLVRVEQSLMALWERVEARGRRVEQRYRAALRLYADLHRQQLLASQSGGAEPWISGLVELQLARIRRRLDQERLRTEQRRQQDLLQQSRRTSRLDRLELQLQALAARTQQVQATPEAAAGSETLPAAVGDGVDRPSHDALLEEVSRLETALGDVRRDVKSLSTCQDWCRQLDRVQQTISDQVREEVRALIYGNQLTAGGDAAAAAAAPAAPESLLQWLSQQFVSPADLQVALASLELSILQNISLQLERRRGEDTEGGATSDAAGTAVTKEEIRAMVESALRRFSEDRTGLADYALESGGGSILSTRCSETYETKAALLSLFGVPLWYFSQSPRAVIQPDVHPGNCWAFRGSTGFLVIRLSMRILPTVFTLEHIPRALAPSGTLRSAPREFSVYGLEDEGQERGTLLGTYTYDQDGDALQMFPASEENDGTFQIIEVQVLSNWGHPEYTCMYRFRVHGAPGA
ncbi:uncharacterized protein LOC142374491 [Odontesthes bonariensis]|uniref:uncharacterized protein LOC142374491 n=1 Tax=Odontesthes bonariensis TaxID=219752 RepID=UPI003F588275